MAKDPRFNFYVDNWIGGTEGFTLEQEGAYLSLIIMQTKVGRFTKEQAFDKLLQKTRGNTAVSTAVLQFLIPKFETDGKLFWSARLEKEMEKSKTHSELQKTRVLARWNKSGINSGNTAVLPDNRNGNRIGSSSTGLEGVQGEILEWANQIVAGNDPVWDKMRGRKITREEMDEFLSVAVRNNWKLDDASKFRITLRGFKSDRKTKTPKQNGFVQ